MGKGRLEAFSDGVLAIIITIMVLELKVPNGTDLNSLRPLAPVFMSYVLSFVYVGIYWNNHHHLLPFATGWMGENHFAPLPCALYGIVLLMAAIAYYLLQRCLMAVEGESSVLRRAVGSDWKGKSSPLIYLVAIGLSFAVPWVALALYVLVAGLWLVPDRRIEKVINGVAD